VAENIDKSTTELFAVHSYLSRDNVAEREALQALGYNVVLVDKEYPELLPEANVSLTHVRLL
jgi:hypothetical protein